MGARHDSAAWTPDLGRTEIEAPDHLASERAIAAFSKGCVDLAENSGEIRAGAATRVENVDLVGGEAVGDSQILALSLIDPRHHIGDYLDRRVPDAEFFSQFGIEGFEKRLVEELHRFGVVESPEEFDCVDPIERRGCSVEYFNELKRLEM